MLFFGCNNPFLPTSLINKTMDKNYSFDIELLYHWTGSVNNADSNQVMHTPIVADINKDKIPDIIFITFSGYVYNTNGTLRVISGVTGQEIFSNLSYSIKPSTTPAAGDIDNDNLPEIVAAADSGKILAFKNDGSLKWESIDSYLLNIHHASISLSNIDHTGLCEIIAGNWVLNHDGTTKWKGSLGAGQYNSCIADIDMSGTQEIAAGNTAYHSDGSIYWQNSEVPDGYTAIGNFDNDLYPEIVVVHQHYVYLLNHDGSKIWGPVFLNDYIAGTGSGLPAIADVDNDNIPEIIIAGKSSLTVLDKNGNIKWQQTINDISSGKTSCSVFDFDNDNNPEVLHSDQEYFRIFDGKAGNKLFEMIVGSGTLLEYPVVVDINNDKSAEIIIAANNYYDPAGNFTNGILVFGDKNNSSCNTRKIWNQHSYHITNVNDNGTIPLIEKNNWQTFNNYRQNQNLK